MFAVRPLLCPWLPKFQVFSPPFGISGRNDQLSMASKHHPVPFQLVRQLYDQEPLCPVCPLSPQTVRHWPSILVN